MTDLPPDSYLARFDAGWTPIDGYWWRQTDTGRWEHAPMTGTEMTWHREHTQEPR